MRQADGSAGVLEKWEEPFPAAQSFTPTLPYSFTPPKFHL